MKINGIPYRTIWPDPVATGLVRIIDQRPLPHRFVVEEIRSVRAMAEAIREMHVRGAPLIGAAAAWGMALAIQPSGPEGAGDWLIRLKDAARELESTRPTAVNQAWAVERMLAVGRACASS